MPFPNEMGLSDTLVTRSISRDDLVLHVLEEAFGEDVRAVARAVMSTYRCTLAYLLRYFGQQAMRKMSTTVVRHALVILQQHRCLIVERPPPSGVLVDGPGGGRRNDDTLLYRVDADMVISRLRAGRMIACARQAASSFSFVLSPVAPALKGSVAHEQPSLQQLESVGEMVLEELILFGRGTLLQVLQSVSAQVSRAAEAGAAKGGNLVSGRRPTGGARGSSGCSENAADSEHAQQQQAQQEAQQLVYQVFRSLVQAHLITRAPSLTINRRVAHIKHKATRSKAAAGADGQPGNAVSATSIHSSGAVRVRGGAASRDRELDVDNQLPDEMLLAERAAAALEVVQKVEIFAVPATPDFAAKKGGSTQSQVIDKYAVIEVRLPERDADGAPVGFGPMSVEVVGGSPAALGAGLASLPSKAVVGGRAKAAAGAAGAAKRSRKRSVVDSDDSEEDGTGAGVGAEPSPEAKKPAKRRAVSAAAAAKAALKAEAEAAAAEAAAAAATEAEEEAALLREAEEALHPRSMRGSDVLWTVNWDQLVEEERIAACVRYILERSKEKAARVVRIILEESLRDESAQQVQSDLTFLEDYASVSGAGASASANVNAKEHTIAAQNTDASTYRHARLCLEYSRPVPLMRIVNTYARRYASSPANASGSLASYDVAGGKEADTALAAAATSQRDRSNSTGKRGNEKMLDVSTMRGLLNVLVSDASLSTCASSNGHSLHADARDMEYQANCGPIISTLQRKTITSIARTRYGIHAARLVELMLCKNEWTEQNVLGDVAIMPARDAREKLYLLYRNKWVDYKEVSKRSDYNPQSTFYFWKIDYSHIKGMVLDHCYHAMLNLRVKRDSILKEAWNRDLEAHALRLYHSVSASSEAHAFASGDAMSTGTKAAGGASDKATTMVVAGDSSDAVKEEDSTALAAGVKVEKADASGIAGTDDAKVNAAAHAIYRGVLERREELLRAGAKSTRGSCAGMDVAIGRLDLAVFNLDRTIMVMERM